jgi:hypothetical protein
MALLKQATSKHRKPFKNDELGGFILGQFEDDVATKSNIFYFETCEEMHVVDKEVLSLPPLSLPHQTYTHPALAQG